MPVNGDATSMGVAGGEGRLADTLTDCVADWLMDQALGQSTLEEIFCGLL